MIPALICFAVLALWCYLAIIYTDAIVEHKNRWFVLSGKKKWHFYVEFVLCFPMMLFISILIRE